jgi:hypothetical protein
MKYFNLYYLDTKLNNRPLNEDELETFKKSKIVSKRNSITGKIENIPVDRIRVIKTIVI